MEQSDGDWTAVIQNIRRVRQVWGILGVILSWEGADPNMLAAFSIAVVQAVIFFGAEMWVLSEAMENRVLGSTWFFCSRWCGNGQRGDWMEAGGKKGLRVRWRQRECSISGYTLIDVKNWWHSGWPANPYLKCERNKWQGYAGGGQIRSPWRGPAQEVPFFYMPYHLSEQKKL